MEQVLRAGDGSVSLALGDEALARPQGSSLPLFLEADGSLVGQYRVEDSGQTLALRPDAVASAARPDLASPVRLSLEALVSASEQEELSLHLELLEDGTLRILAPASAAGLGREVVTAYALAALKRHAGVEPAQVRAAVLRYEG